MMLQLLLESELPYRYISYQSFFQDGFTVEKRCWFNLDTDECVLITSNSVHHTDMAHMIADVDEASEEIIDSRVIADMAKLEWARVTLHTSFNIIFLNVTVGDKYQLKSFVRKIHPLRFNYDQFHYDCVFDIGSGSIEPFSPEYRKLLR